MDPSALIVCLNKHTRVILRIPGNYHVVPLYSKHVIISEEIIVKALSEAESIRLED